MISFTKDQPEPIVGEKGGSETTSTCNDNKGHNNDNNSLSSLGAETSQDSSSTDISGIIGTDTVIDTITDSKTGVHDTNTSVGTKTGTNIDTKTDTKTDTNTSSKKTKSSRTKDIKKVGKLDAYHAQFCCHSNWSAE